MPDDNKLQKVDSIEFDQYFLRATLATAKQAVVAENQGLGHKSGCRTAIYYVCHHRQAITCHRSQVTGQSGHSTVQLYSTYTSVIHRKSDEEVMKSDEKKLHLP